VYAREVQNYDDHGDEGEVWFGSACERRVLDWIAANVPKDAAALDLGCGNGHFALRLLQRGFRVLGATDYSESALALARRLLCSDASGAEVRIFLADILAPEKTAPCTEHHRYDLVVDKGAFDAISLNPDIAGDGTAASKTALLALRLKAALGLFFAPNSKLKLFVITSCNWTVDELKALFGAFLQPVAEIPHTKFTFGGHTGQDVSTVVFRYTGQ
jgi:SAM-dependent methyltransferase